MLDVSYFPPNHQLLFDEEKLLTLVRQSESYF